MGRLAVLLVAGLASFPTVASEPGERFDASDITVMLRGLSVETFLEPFDASECEPGEPFNPIKCARGVRINALDAEGHFYFIGTRNTRHTLWRQRSDREVELVAEIAPERVAPDGSTDHGEFLDAWVDNVNGWVYIRLATKCTPALQCGYSHAIEVVRLSGVPTLLEVLKRQTRDRRGPWR